MPSLGPTSLVTNALAGLCFLRIGGDADHLCNLVRGTLQHQLLEVWGEGDSCRALIGTGTPLFFGSKVGFSAEKGRPSTENKGNGTIAQAKTSNVSNKPGLTLENAGSGGQAEKRYLYSQVRRHI